MYLFHRGNSFRRSQDENLTAHMPGCAQRAWNALIRTHHITSRKKVAKLRQAAAAHDVFAILRSGSSPGIMYVEGAQEGVENWVAAVQVGAATRYSI